MRETAPAIWPMGSWLCRQCGRSDQRASQLRAIFTNTKRELWPGTFVQARVLVRTDRQATVVPDTAVQTSETGSFVHVLGADGTANQRKVITGPSMEGFTEIASGLNTAKPW
jgi:multidrug efflux system membrane fusion protein